MTPLLVAAALVTLLAPPAPADVGSLHIPAPRVGDRFERTTTITDLKTGEVWPGGVESFAFPQADRPVMDAFGVQRRGYPVAYGECAQAPCEPGIVGFADLSLRDVFASVDASSSTSDGPLPQRVTSADVQWRALALSSASLSLQGSDLAPGTTIDHAGPFMIHGPQTSTGALTAVGWTTVEGRALFEVDLPVFGGTIADHYDGDLPIPAFTRYQYSAWMGDGTRHEIQGDIRVTSATRGDGPLLEDANYQAVPWRGKDTDAPTSVYTVDGPSESMVDAFPLHMAVAAARADIHTRSWFTLHPNAFLFNGYYSDTYLWFPKPTWGLLWGDGYELLGVTVAGLGTRDHVHAAVATAVDQIQADGFFIPPAPPRDEFVGYTFPCGAAVERAIAQRLPTMEPGPLGLARTLEFRPDDTRNAKMACDLVIQPDPLPVPRDPPVAPNAEGLAWAELLVSNGAVTSAGYHRDTRGEPIIPIPAWLAERRGADAPIR